MKADLARDPFRNGGLKGFMTENVLLREINVPGGVIEQAILVPGSRLEIPNMTDYENKGQDAKQSHEPSFTPQAGRPLLDLPEAWKVSRQQENKTPNTRQPGDGVSAILPGVMQARCYRASDRA